MPHSDQDKYTAQQVSPDYSSITTLTSARISKAKLSRVLGLIRNAFADDLNGPIDSKEKVEVLHETEVVPQQIPQGESQISRVLRGRYLLAS